MTDTNPQLEDIDARWESMWRLLRDGQGRTIRDNLLDIRKDYPGLYNALYWRIDDWLATYLGRAELTTTEQRAHLTAQEIGKDRLRGFIQERIQGDCWTPFDLPRLLSDMLVAGES